MSLLAFIVAGCVTASSLTNKVEIGTGTLGPVPAGQAALVRITAADAATTVLEHERETGWPDLDIAWRDGGCVRLAWFEPSPMSFAPDPGPPYSVYLVRLIDEADASRVMWVMVDARSGELGAAIGDPIKADCGAVGVRLRARVASAGLD